MRPTSYHGEAGRAAPNAGGGTRLRRRRAIGRTEILSPFVPHLGAELWQRLGHTQSSAYEPWLAHDEAKLARDIMVIAV